MVGTYSRGLAVGGGPKNLNQARVDAARERFTVEVLQADSGIQQPRPVNAATTTYASAQGSTSQVPAGVQTGVPLPVGRVWVEGYGLTCTVAGAVIVTVIATQNGVRATFQAPAGGTFTAGAARFWLFDDVSQQWALGPVSEDLATGAGFVTTSDQQINVGGGSY